MSKLNPKYRIIQYPKEIIDDWMQFKEKYPEIYTNYLEMIKETGESFQLLEVDSISRSKECEDCPYKVYKEHPWGYSYILDCEWDICYKGKSREEIKVLLEQRERNEKEIRRKIEEKFPDTFGKLKQPEEDIPEKEKTDVTNTKEPEKVIKEEKIIMAKKEEKEVEKKYKVVTLCGSTRFKEEFDKIAEKLTLQGIIVLAPGEYSKYCKKDNELTEDIIEMLKDLHKEKIRMADEVLIINKDGYIGESTKEEIHYALSIGKPVFYIENSEEETCLNKLKFVLETQNKKLSDEAVDAISRAIDRKSVV